MSTEQLSPTVYGVETEYTCAVTLPGSVMHELVGSCHSEDIKLGLYQEPEDKGTAHISKDAFDAALQELGIFSNCNGMLSNGGRFYIDPSGPEYATPEHTTAEGAVHASYDGDAIVFKIFRSLQESNIIEDFQLNRRIVDHNRTSRGIHLNTATSIEKPTKHMVDTLSALNVAKGAIFGSGGLLNDKDGNTAFHHSPRLSITNAQSYNSVSYTSRPLVRQPFKSDEGSSYRIESISSDALSFAWPMRASMVMSNALVKLIEIGQGQKLPVLRNAENAACIVGRYGNRNMISLRIGDNEYDGVRPLVVIKRIAELALETHDSRHHLDNESVQVLREVIEVSDIIETDPLAAAPYVESIARQETMRRKMESEGVNLDSDKMCKFDFYWDKIGGGLAEKLRQSNKAGWLGFTHNHSTKMTEKRILVPPRDTRAVVRGQLILDTKGDNSSGWYSFDIDGDRIDVSPLTTSVGS